MLQIDNHTPFGIGLFPVTDPMDQEFLVVAIKGKFSIATLQQSVTIADKQENPLPADIYWGEPDNSSVRYEADTALRKRAIDLVVLGCAYAQQGQLASTVQVAITAGDVSKRLHVSGNRVWDKTLSGWVPTQAKSFKKMPIVYERAFGGSDLKSLQQKQPLPSFFELNPVGKGFTNKEHAAPELGLPLPNVEIAGHLIEDWQDQPNPAGFGFINRAWLPRRTLAGTYDDEWQSTRMPLIPHDFNEQYFSAASQGMSLPLSFAHDGWIDIKNMTPSGHLCFGLPPIHLLVSVKLRHQTSDFLPVLDTIVVEPDALTVSLTWRAAIPCTRKLLHIKNVGVNWRKSS